MSGASARAAPGGGGAASPSRPAGTAAAGPDGETGCCVPAARPPCDGGRAGAAFLGAGVQLLRSVRLHRRAAAAMEHRPATGRDLPLGDAGEPPRLPQRPLPGHPLLRPDQGEGWGRGERASPCAPVLPCTRLGCVRARPPVHACTRAPVRAPLRRFPCGFAPPHARTRSRCPGGAAGGARAGQRCPWGAAPRPRGGAAGGARSEALSPIPEAARLRPAGLLRDCSGSLPAICSSGNCPERSCFSSVSSAAVGERCNFHRAIFN